MGASPISIAENAEALRNSLDTRINPLSTRKISGGPAYKLLQHCIKAFCTVVELTLLRNVALEKGVTSCTTCSTGFV